MHFNASCPCASLALMIALGVAPVSSADAQTLTLQEAQRLAVGRSQLLIANDATVTAAREMAVAARQLPDPVLKIGIDNLPVDGSDRFSLSRDFMTMRRVGVMQEMTREDKRRLRSERYERQAEKAAVEKARAAATIERSTALAWIDRHYAEAMAALIADAGAQARLEIDAVESAYRGGRGSQADVFAAMSVVAGIEERSVDIGRRVRAANIALARWIGDVADSVRLGDLPDTNAIRLPTDALEAHLQAHPEIAAMLRDEEAARTEAALAQAAKRADWTWEVAFQNRGSSYSNMVSVGVSIPLQWDQANRQDREIAAKLALVDETRARRDDALRAHVAEVRAMIADWESSRARRARYRDELLPLASRRTEALVAAYRGGKAALADVLLARRNETELRMQALQLDLDIARSWAQLEFLLPSEAWSRPPKHATLTGVPSHVAVPYSPLGRPGGVLLRPEAP